MFKRRLVIVAAAITFFANPGLAAEICDNPTQSCGRLMTQGCLLRLGAGIIPSSDPQCGEQAQTYRECLAFVASRCSRTESTHTNEDEKSSFKNPSDLPKKQGEFETLEHVFAEPKGCVISKTLPVVTKLKIREGQTFCREDGIIFIRITAVGNSRFHYNTLDGSSTYCNYTSVTCAIEDSEEGSFSVQVVRMDKDRDGPFIELIVKRK